MLSDGDHIRNLLGEYCHRIDAGDFEGVGELFADGVLADEDGRPMASGAAEVAAFYRSGTQLHGDRPGTKHLVVDTVLEETVPEENGPAEITARSSYVVFQVAEGLALQPIITGRYVDRFDRPGGMWRFAERRFFVDQVGDLSHHLTFLLPEQG
jgi:hypothetical protein